MKVLLTIALGSLVSLAKAQEAENAIPVSAMKTALQWMQNADPAKRAAAYRTFQLYGDTEQDRYRKTLNAAQDLHEDRLERLMADERKNPFLELDQIAENLQAERERIFALIHTDYHKDPGEVRKLLDEVESLARINKQARKLAAAKSEKFDEEILIIGTSMAEVARELKIIEGEKPGNDALDPEAALANCYEGSVYLKTKSNVSRLRKEIDDLAAAKTTNDGFGWANQPQKEFTNHLNNFRSLFALTPLILDEQLSAAAVGHSQDMAVIGFFSHTSPVDGKSSPGDRARLANFKHRWSGENIYMGSSSPVAAYDAWFASDGHRFIMFSRGPDLIGAGPYGKHWTMMTGTK